jgi:hypothetical protein
MTITTVLVIFGLALIFWAITATGSHPGRRATAVGTGIFALLLAALFGNHDGGRDRWDA